MKAITVILAMLSISILAKDSPMTLTQIGIVSAAVTLFINQYIFKNERQRTN